MNNIVEFIRKKLNFYGNKILKLWEKVLILTKINLLNYRRKLKTLHEWSCKIMRKKVEHKFLSLFWGSM